MQLFFSGPKTSQRSQAKTSKNNFHFGPDAPFGTGIPEERVHFATAKIWVGRSSGLDRDTNQNLVSKQKSQGQKDRKSTFGSSVQMSSIGSYIQSCWISLYWMLLQARILWINAPRYTHSDSTAIDCRTCSTNDTITHRRRFGFTTHSTCCHPSKLNIFEEKNCTLYKALVTYQ